MSSPDASSAMLIALTVGPTAAPEDLGIAGGGVQAGRLTAVVSDDKAGVRGRLDLSGAQWKRSSQPGVPGAGQLEIAVVDGYIAMRNSADPDGTVLVFTPAEWDAFVRGAGDGELDEP